MLLDTDKFDIWMKNISDGKQFSKGNVILILSNLISISKISFFI